MFSLDINQGGGTPGPGRPRFGSRVAVSDATGRRKAVDCNFVAAADGGSSTVRRRLNIRLAGGSAELSNISVLFRSDTLAAAITLDPAVQYWVLGPEVSGMVGRLDLAQHLVGHHPGRGRQRITPTPERLVRSLVGADVDVGVIATDPWTARMLLAPGYGARRRVPDRGRGAPQSALGRARLQHVHRRRRQPGLEDRRRPGGLGRPGPARQL